MLLTFSKWCSRSSAFFFSFFLQTPKGHQWCCSDTFLPISAALSGHGTVCALVCASTRASWIFTDLVKYLVKFGFFYHEQWASGSVSASSSFRTGKAQAGLIHWIVPWSSVEDRKKDLRKAEKAAMETRRRGKSTQESIADSVYLGRSGTEEHAQVLKTRQWLDRSGWNSSWMRLHDLSCWQHVGMVSGLTLAGVIGLFHAWYVYSIHENLLWFSQLEVRRTTLKGKSVDLRVWSSVNILILYAVMR